jgi:hypothetical protein
MQFQFAKAGVGYLTDPDYSSFLSELDHGDHDKHIYLSLITVIMMTRIVSPSVPSTISAI